MINKAIIVGRLGGDPEIRSTQSGTSVTTFTVATNEKWKDQSGQLQESTEWHRIVSFGKLAEICGNLLNKGSQVYIEGRIQTRKWQDQNGNDRYTTEIVAREMKILSSKRDSDSGGSGGGTGGAYNQDYYDSSPNQGSMGDDVPF